MVAVLVISLAFLVVGTAVASTIAAFWLHDSLVRTQEAEDSATEQLWQSLAAQARAGRSSRRAGQRFASLDALRRAAALRPTVDLRSQAIGCLALADLRPAESFALGDARWMSFDSDLTRYAVDRPNGDIVVRWRGDAHEEIVLPGPGGAAKRMDWSPDGRYLAIRQDASDSRSAGLRLWEVDERKTILDLDGFQGSVAFAADSRVVATIDSRGATSLRALPSLDEIGKLEVAARVFGAAFRTDGKLLAVSSGGTGHVQIWDLATARATATFEHAASVYGIAWHPTGEYLAVGTSAGTIVVWDIETEREHAVLSGHQAEVVELTFSHSGRFLASRGWDFSTRVWDVADGREVVAAEGAIPIPAFSADDSRLAGFVTGSRQIGIWEFASGGESRVIAAQPNQDKVYEVQFSPDSRILLTSGSGPVTLWDADTLDEIGTLSEASSAMYFHPQSGDLYGSGPGGFRRWPMRRSGDGATVYLGPVEVVVGPKDGGQLPTAMDASGRFLARVVGPRTAVIHDFEHPERRVTLDHERGRGIYFSPDARFVVTATWQGTGVKVFRVDDGALERELPVEGSARVAFHPDGATLVTVNAIAFCVWDTSTWALRRTWPREGGDGYPGSVAFSPDGRLAALGVSQFLVQLVDGESFELLANVDHRDFEMQWPMGFSPDGALLALVAGRNKLRIQDLRQVREELAAIGLDWDAPPIPARREPRRTRPLRLEILAER